MSRRRKDGLLGEKSDSSLVSPGSQGRGRLIASGKLRYHGTKITVDKPSGKLSHPRSLLPLPRNTRCTAWLRAPCPPRDRSSKEMHHHVLDEAGRPGQQPGSS